MPSASVEYTPENSITISETGVYEIDYYATISTEAQANTITMAVRNGTENIPSTEVAITTGNSNTFTYSGSTIVDLTEGDIIDMAGTPSTGSGNLVIGSTTSDSVGALLTVKKISE